MVVTYRPAEDTVPCGAAPGTGVEVGRNRQRWPDDSPGVGHVHVPGRRTRAVVVATVLALVAALGSACTADAARTVDGRGGSVNFPGAGGLTITVPPGAVSSSTRVEADTDQPAPASTFGPDVREIGRPYTIVSAVPLPGARVTVPVDLRQVGQSGRADVFLAVYSDQMQVWVPLPTDLDVRAGTLSVPAPHFSTYQVFGYDIFCPARSPTRLAGPGTRPPDSPTTPGAA